VAQPGRAPGSGPGGRRFKSSLPDQFFSIFDSKGYELVESQVSKSAKPAAPGRMTKMMVCECGFPLSSAGQGLYAHRRSPYHRHHRRIKALLSKNEISYAEIGARLGLTRERVRQIAEKAGMPPGRQRQKQCVVDRRTSAWREHKGHREVIAKCEELGYTVMPSRRVNSTDWYLEANIVVINGWRVRIVYTNWTRSGYLRVKRFEAHADFYLSISPVGFFIFPSKVWRTFPASTAFSSDPSTSDGGVVRSSRHDYLDYLEAWKLLKGKAKSMKSSHSVHVPKPLQGKDR
jgi:hypothetical protein